MVREPVVAGQFYSGSRDSLLREVDGLVGKASGKENAIGLVSPHAGYVYSGLVAGAVFASIKPKAAYVIMGPNHTGMGEAFGIATNDSWRTPLGDARIDKALAGEIRRNCKYVRADDLSHMHEHSIEVQLPFLQFVRKDFKFVPIVISYSQLAVYQEIGKAIAKAIRELGLEKDAAIIASSDMTHYEPHDVAKKKDAAAIDAVLKLDEAGLYDVVSRLDISMCGYAPTCIMIAAAKELGAKNARLVKYQTSGDISGDYSSVVGYAGIVVA